MVEVRQMVGMVADQARQEADAYRGDEPRPIQDLVTVTLGERPSRRQGLGMATAVVAVGLIAG